MDFILGKRKCFEERWRVKRVKEVTVDITDVLSVIEQNYECTELQVLRCVISTLPRLVNRFFRIRGGRGGLRAKGTY